MEFISFFLFVNLFYSFIFNDLNDINYKGVKRLYIGFFYLGSFIFVI